MAESIFLVIFGAVLGLLMTVFLGNPLQRMVDRMYKNAKIKRDSKKQYPYKIEKIIRGIKSFKKAHIIHGIIKNTIAFGDSGFLIVYLYGKSILLAANEITGIEFNFPQKDDFPPLFYCILKTNKKEHPEIKILLAYGEPERAAELHVKIEEHINACWDYWKI